MESFAERRAMIEREATEHAAKFMSNRPIGSWVTLEQFNMAMGGWRVVFQDVQAIMEEKYNRTFWTVMGEGKPHGFIIGDESVIKGLKTRPGLAVRHPERMF